MKEQLDLTLIGTVPVFPVGGASPAAYRERIKKVGTLADRHGWQALLVYSDHKAMDPWLSAQILMSEVDKVSPLVAVQPLYMHPFSIAKMVACLSTLYNRPVHINYVSGGHPRDLETFCDTSEHDERYERLFEYAQIVSVLLKEKRPCTFSGRFYRVKNLQLRFGPLPPHLMPMLMTSGSSPAGVAAARKIGARAIRYLSPSDDKTPLPDGIPCGTRLALVVRESSAQAWEVARRRFPVDPVRAEVRKHHVQMSDSVWVKELAKEYPVREGHPYWLQPYQQGHISSPVLVGSYEEVATELARYIMLGLRTFLFENPLDDQEAAGIEHVFTRAKQLTGIASQPQRVPLV